MTKLYTIRLTDAERRAALDAIGQMTDGNARDFSEWRQQTSGHISEWRALLRAEAKLDRA
jgi:hypothetical protein